MTQYVAKKGLDWFGITDASTDNEVVTIDGSGVNTYISNKNFLTTDPAQVVTTVDGDQYDKCVDFTITAQTLAPVLNQYQNVAREIIDLPTKCLLYGTRLFVARTGGVNAGNYYVALGTEATTGDIAAKTANWDNALTQIDTTFLAANTDSAYAFKTAPLYLAAGSKLYLNIYSKTVGGWTASTSYTMTPTVLQLFLKFIPS